MPAYVFLGAVSVFFVVGDLAAVLEGLAVAAGFLTVLPDDLPGALLEDGALRLEEDLVVVVDFPVTAFAFDPGLATGFAGILVLVAVFEVFEAGLFWDDDIKRWYEGSRPPRLTSFASSPTLGVFGASFTRPDGPKYTKPKIFQSHENLQPLGSEKMPFSAPTAIALLS